MSAHPPTFGLILAGGLGRRLGGVDKALVAVGGRTVLERVTARLVPQVAALALNANGDPARFGDALPVMPDPLPDRPGPLAGVLAGLDEIARRGGDWLLTVPADCPFLPVDLVSRLHAQRADHPIACAVSAGRHHPVIALWPARLRGPLRAALEGGERRVGVWAGEQGSARVAWPATPYDPFLNINTAEDLAAAEAIAAAYPDA
ncbi:molybdenum cofactor guanylyltransferase MobA [Ancylobacter terrae]|uniref:molybdenum cofactor guanylyltransferase MobA n=1 Tax=Ancylobacter sp. sgz301288 TaxID=3342077 RepID=UPI00385CB0F9